MQNLTSRLSTMARRAAAPILITAAVVAACGGDGTGPGVVMPNLVGDYTMTTIEGHSVPHTFTDPAGSQLTIDGGTLKMHADSTYELRYSGRLNSNDFTLGNDGVFDTSDGLKFYPSSGGYYSGQVNGNTVLFKRKIAGVMFELGFTVQP